MATFTQIWMLSCVLLVAPTVVAIVILIVKNLILEITATKRANYIPSTRS